MFEDKERMRKQNKTKTDNNWKSRSSREKKWQQEEGEGVGETDRESAGFMQGALLTFPTNPAQFSLASHFLVCNHYETVPSPDTNTNYLQHLPLSEPEPRLQTSKTPTATDSQRQAFPFGSGSSDSLAHVITLHFWTEFLLEYCCTPRMLQWG